jgi:heme/copper-type cytochrome/quinol oxidase subunit 3
MNINVNSNCYNLNCILIISNSIIIYWEVLVEYLSIYINNNFSNNNMVLIIIISECIIIITSMITYNSINSMSNNVIIDGMILTDSNYNMQYINSNLSMVSNIIVYMWYNSNIYKYIVNYVDICLIIWVIVFIELQLKEYINYNSYMNECIFISVVMLLLGIHLTHIGISSILINYSYNIVLVKLKYILLIVYINIFVIISIIILIYWHLVSVLWYIICSITL